MSVATAPVAAWPAQRMLLVLALLAAILPLTAQPAAADAAESELVARINQERSGRGLSQLRVAGDLVAVARRHSQRMADRDGIYHNPSLGSEVSGWQKVGENVGRGPSASSLHQGFMSSPSHRANVVDSEWLEVGVGVVRAGDRLYVTELFRLPEKAAEPEPEPEPAPEPSRSAAPTAEVQAAAADPADGDTAGAAATGDEASGSAPSPTEDPTPVSTPALERGLDRTSVMLAWLEAAEHETSLAALLD